MKQRLGTAALCAVTITLMAGLVWQSGLKEVWDNHKARHHNKERRAMHPEWPHLSGR